MHSIRTVEDRMEADTGFAQQVDRLDDQIAKSGGLSA
jgi:hypothetical protein